MITTVAETAPLPLRLYRDHLYISADAYQTYLPSIRSVVLLRKGDDLLIMPIANIEAGGFYIKQINAQGDRAIHAADFFRMHAIDDTSNITIDALPHKPIAGFIVKNLFS